MESGQNYLFHFISEVLRSVIDIRDTEIAETRNVANDIPFAAFVDVDHINAEKTVGQEQNEGGIEETLGYLGGVVGTFLHE